MPPAFRGDFHECQTLLSVENKGNVMALFTITLALTGICRGYMSCIIKELVFRERPTRYNNVLNYSALEIKPTGSNLIKISESIKKSER